MSIQFYHLTTTPFERALPRLIEKAYISNYRILLLAENDDRVEQLNQLLWMYDAVSFLPHGSVNDNTPEKQPVYIASHQENLNRANLLFITQGALAASPEAFERVVDLFDGNNPQAVSGARERWKAYKEQGQALTYYNQNAKGGWEKNG